MKIRMLSNRKLIEIISKTMSVHLQKREIPGLVKYTETEAELLVKYLTSSKLMTASMLILQDEATEDVPDPDKYKHLTLCITDELDNIKEEDLKMIELEVNLFEMADACTETEVIRQEIEERIKECVLE